jgi:hypothetical protein
LVFHIYEVKNQIFWKKSIFIPPKSEIFNYRIAFIECGSFRNNEGK